MSGKTHVLSAAAAVRMLVLMFGIALVAVPALAADYEIIRNPDGTFTTVPPEGLPALDENIVPAQPVPQPTEPPTFVDYTSAQNGNWSSSSTWSPAGVPGATDNVIINHTVTNDGGASVNNITIGTGTFVQSSSSCSLTVWGNWTNNGTVTHTAGAIKFRGTTNSTIGGSNPTTFYLVRAQKQSVLDSIFLGNAVTISINAAPALHIDTGTVVTNGYNLTVNGGTSSRVQGGAGARSRLVCNGGSTVNINYIYGWSVNVTVANPATTLNVYTQWDVVNSGQRVDIFAGTVNILGTGSSSLRLLTNNSGYGWFMTGGTLNLSGGITTSIGSWYTATDSSKVRFVGTTSATVLMMSGTSSYNHWVLNEVRVEKTGGATVSFTTSSGPVAGNVTAVVGLTVNSANTLDLAGSFRADSGYVFGSVTNNGTITVSNGSEARHITVTGAFTNNGSFTLANRVLRLGTASASGSVTNGSGATFSAVGNSTSDTACVAAIAEAYPYGFTVQSGATIAARYATFRWMNSSGVNVAVGATVNATNNFSNCSFLHGAISGPMLKLENSATIVMNEVNFYGTAGYNIEKLGAVGLDSVKGGLGTLWGENYDNDPNNLVYWEPPGDVGAYRIIAPLDTILYGTLVTPRAMIRNFGVVPKSFSVRLNIGTVYNDTQVVNNLAAGDSVQVTFANWSATNGGLQVVRCSTRLRGDGDATNDKVTDTCFVLIIVDAGVTQIVQPVGGSTIDSGTVVAPSCSVRNYGSLSVNFTTTFRIPPYSNSRIVIGLMPDSSRLVSGFTNWTAVTRGWNMVSCTTSLSGDINNTNDIRRDSVFVAVHDVGPTVIVRPAGSVTPGPVTPVCTLRNYGNTVENCRAWFRIEQGGTPVWLDSANVTGLSGDVEVTFPDAYNAGGGVFTTTCWTTLGTDQVPANDTIRGGFQTGTVDVAVTTITAPVGSLDTGANVTPAAVVRNNGSFAATFGAWFFIDSAGTRIYSSTRTVTALAPGTPTPVTFDLLPKPHAVGSYATRCSVYLAGDATPSNDVMDGTFRFVTAPPTPPGWHPKPPMPAGVKPVKDGGWIAWSECTEKVYAARGNKQSDLFSYNPIDSVWVKKSDWPLGIEAKPPSKGAAATPLGYPPMCDLYATKGNSTQGFWKYTTTTDSWKPLAQVPLGFTNKKVKGGTDLVTVPDSLNFPQYVYLLKGYKNEFWKYDISKDSWTAMPNAPVGSSGKDKYDKGSWLALVEDAAGTMWQPVIYCHKAKYHELFKYDVLKDSWVGQLTGMPFIGMMGKSKKSKDGGSATYYAGYIYALKGGNTQEFWRYNVAKDSWEEKDTVPLVGQGSTKKKKVKAGGDICLKVPTGKAVPVDLPALKGNGTNEFWMYNTGEVLFAAATPDARQGVMATTVGSRHQSLVISPNPLAAGFAQLSYSLPGAGAASLYVYDVTGRAVVARSLLATRSGSTNLDLRNLSAGVYLVKLSAGDFISTHKLVVQK